MSTIQNKQLDSSGGNEIDLLEIFYQLLNHKWLILMISSLTLSLGLLYTSRLVPQYRADVLLQIESKQQNMGQIGGVAQQLLMGSQGSDVATQIALIQSRFVLQPVIKLLGLDINVSVKRSFWSKLLSSDNKKRIQVALFDVPFAQNNKPFELVVDSPNHVRLYNAANEPVLEGRVGSTLINSAKTIQLRISAIDASVGTHFILKKASELTVINSLLSRLKIQESVGQQQRQSTGVVTVSLTGPDPQQVIQALNAIAKVTQVKDVEKKSLEASKTLNFLYQQLPLTKKMLEKAETDLNKYRAKSGKIDIKFQAKLLLDRLAELDKKLTVLRVDKIDGLQKYTPDHPVLMALNTTESTLEAEHHRLEQQLKLLPASDQIAVNLLRDVGVKKTLYLILLTKIQEFQVLKAGTVSGVHILSQAMLPDGALPNKRVFICFVSLFLGLLISGTIVFIRKLINVRVADPHWSERHFNIANLAIIPYCKEQADNAKLNKENASNQIMLLAHANPRSLSIESLRSLRTSLQVSLASASNNIVSILGVTPGVGKSFVSANLAYLLSAAGKRVVLVDGDLRRGTVHKYFNGIASPGVSEVLSGKVELAQALVHHLNDNMTFLPRGAYPTDPSELLMSERFKELMKTLSEQYDVVIVDTPPVLLVTDAVVIAGYSATNYLVLGAAAHQAADIEMVLKRLSSSAVQVHGTIFNFYRMATSNHSYYGQYGRYGRYGKYSQYNTYYYDDSIKN